MTGGYAGNFCTGCGKLPCMPAFAGHAAMNTRNVRSRFFIAPWWPVDGALFSLHGVPSCQPRMNISLHSWSTLGLFFGRCGPRRTPHRACVASLVVGGSLIVCSHKALACHPAARSSPHEPKPVTTCRLQG